MDGKVYEVCGKKMNIFDAIAMGLQTNVPELALIDRDELVADLKEWAEMANSLCTNDSRAEVELLGTYLMVMHQGNVSVEVLESVESFC